LLTKVDQTAAAVLALTPVELDLGRHFAAGSLDLLQDADVLVCPTDDPGGVLVFGTDDAARELGSIVQPSQPA